MLTRDENYRKQSLYAKASHNPSSTL